MKYKVLIVCNYFPPCNGAPAWRPYSWASDFHKHELHVTVMTRHWIGTENTWIDYLVPDKRPAERVKNENYDILYLPTKRYWFNDFLTDHPWARWIFGNPYFLILAFLGRFNTEVDVYLSFKKQLELELKQHAYDAVLISSPPSNVLELIKVVRKHSKALVIADFRDLWNNLILSENYRPGLKQRVWDYFYAAYYKKWLKRADLVTVIIEPFAEVLGKLTQASIEVVYNGFESTMFSRLKKQESGRFIFSIVGSIYPEQDLTILLDGLRDFLKDKSADKVQLRFIGVSSLPKVAEMIRTSVPEEFLYISGRVPKEEALQETLNAHVLFYSGWKGVRGMVSTKVFDYIASGNFVLIAPGDGDVLDKIVKECESGCAVNSKEEFLKVINELYDEWSENGSLRPRGNKEKVEKYSRESQAERMASLIRNLVTERSQKSFTEVTTKPSGLNMLAAFVRKTFGSGPGLFFCSFFMCVLNTDSMLFNQLPYL